MYTCGRRSRADENEGEGGVEAGTEESGDDRFPFVSPFWRSTPAARGPAFLPSREEGEQSPFPLKSMPCCNDGSPKATSPRRCVARSSILFCSSLNPSCVARPLAALELERGNEGEEAEPEALEDDGMEQVEDEGTGGAWNEGKGRAEDEHSSGPERRSSIGNGLGKVSFPLVDTESLSLWGLSAPERRKHGSSSSSIVSRFAREWSGVLDTPEGDKAKEDEEAAAESAAP